MERNQPIKLYPSLRQGSMIHIYDESFKRKDRGFFS